MLISLEGTIEAVRARGQSVSHLEGGGGPNRSQPATLASKIALTPWTPLGRIKTSQREHFKSL